MGKYMRKAKVARDLAVMDLTHGVRTRAKTLALKKQQGMKLHASSASPPPSSPSGYLQLRSRRLEKKPPPIPSLHHDSPRRKGGPNNGGLGQQQQEKEEEEGEEGESATPSPSPNLKSSSRLGKNSGSGEDKEGGESKLESREIEENNNSNSDSKDLGSFGDNVLDIEGRDRSTRESTPCNLTRGTEGTRTPGSATKSASPTESSRRLQNSIRRRIPTASEMDEFFGPAEEEQLKQFTEKYNFDPINDKPLPGRYEWEKLDH